MTQLLISVKNVAESMIASAAGVDVIDLKDPSIGALGALDTNIVSDIVGAVESTAILSATVGEGHQQLDALISDIQLYDSLGIDIIKIAVSDLFYQQAFVTEMLKLTKQGVQLVAVFFADATPDLNLLSKFQNSGFYGAMVDTQCKHAPLLKVQTPEYLQAFVNNCRDYDLHSGLAGSVNKSHIATLLELDASFIGLRGGVCDGGNRMSALTCKKILEVKLELKRSVVKPQQ